jgi:2-methylisocitrate lyase-like PEP mutase family enzyme
MDTRATRLRSLHQRGNPLVLVNAWDVASAQRIVAAGARAVATSSSAMAASLGVPDDPSAPLDVMFDAIARIARAVDVPVTADLLDGYGLDAAELVDRLLATGAVGCNLEDSDHDHPGTLRAPETITARIDAYLHNGPGATADVVARARAYLDAGADCVYPVTLTDPDTVRQLVEALDAPVNANVRDAAALSSLAAAGASRISVGPMAFHSAMAALDTLAAGLLDG